MRRLLLIAPILLLVSGAVWFVTSGADLRVAAWAAGWQREFQTTLASGLRALRAGEPGALGAMLSICFAYGFFHAVGPGHGKFLIGGYGLGREVPVLRLSAISVLSSLGQAGSAVALVGTGLFALGWTRQQLTDTAESVMLPLGTLAIALVGAWLMLRGALRLWRVLRPAAAPAAAHAHDHHHDHSACGCGHRHGPAPEDLEGRGTLAETLALIASIAIRPCSGAILLLVLTWHMGIFGAGVLGTVAMSLGTAALTVAVAVVSVFARRSTVLSLGSGGRARLAMPAIEIAAGLLAALLAIEMIGVAV
ncbi:nickel/cobalt transporter [Limimaricola pyoseonensis]|uniref:Nickel/cobalt efflux system n=1 Tax=Limimaricola pyoseonensis TaxID=521013 RepID=A0A1G6ZZW1_9RHOB|nr:hypothetical protein [Limimaricola pyoseonensis]SDE08112.1 ABC-type nickel/cobalt efflux system, permease component RcnA [Limimaricola pyoseonensis]